MFEDKMIEEDNGTYRVWIRNSLTDGIAILLLLVGGGIIYAGFTAEPKMWGVVLGGTAAVVLGVLMFFVFKIRKLIAVITEEGITERASKVSDGLIRWEEIESVYIYDSGLRRGKSGATDVFVGIKLKDADAYGAKLRGIKRMLFKFNMTVLGNNAERTPINIPCNVLGNDAERVVEICETMLNKSRNGV